MSGLLAGAQVIWRGARRPAAASVALQLLLGATVSAQLLAGSVVLAHLFTSPGTSLAAVAAPVLALIGSTIVAGMIMATQHGRDELLRLQVETAVMDELAAAVNEAPLVCFEESVFNDRLHRARMTGGGQIIALVSGLSATLQALATAIGAVVALGVLQPLLVPLVLLSGIPLIAVAVRSGRSYYALSEHLTASERMRVYLAHVLLTREHAAELRATSASSFLRQRYRALSTERLDELRRHRRARRREAVAGQLVAAVVMAGVVGAIAAMYSAHLLSVAQLTVAAGAILQLRGRLDLLSFGAAQLHEGALFIHDNRGFVSELRAAATTEGRLRPGALTELAVRDITFAYPGMTGCALSEVSLAVGQGEVVALVGANGAGKTTLARIIAGLYAPREGCVTWNGEPLSQLDPAALRQQIALVPQDFGRYRLTAGENIALRSDADPEAVQAAAAASGAHEVIAELGGYETLLAKDFPGGYDLSIGQWQRVALARALFRGASLIVLDEPTASLDTLAEQAFFDAVRRTLRDRAVVFISHRLASVRYADRIYVLDRGRVVEEGSHPQLVALQGIYASLYQAQADAFSLEREEIVDQPARVP